MKKKEEALKEILMQGTQCRQIRAVIKMILRKSKYALTQKEIHSYLQSLGYNKTFEATRKELYRMSIAGEVMVNKDGKKHYFVI